MSFGNLLAISTQSSGLRSEVQRIKVTRMMSLALGTRCPEPYGPTRNDGTTAQRPARDRVIPDSKDKIKLEA